MVETTGHDPTLALLVPPRSRGRGGLRLAVSLGLLVATIATATWWPGVGSTGFSYVEESAGGGAWTSVFVVDRRGPAVPLTLRGAVAPAGWRIAHAGVAAPADDIHADVGTEHLAMPGRLVDGSRVVVRWEVDCDAAIEVASTTPSMISTSIEEMEEAPAGTTLYLRPQTAVLHMRMLGLLPARVGSDWSDTWLSRTPGVDLAEACGLTQAQVDSVLGMG